MKRFEVRLIAEDNTVLQVERFPADMGHVYSFGFPGVPLLAEDPDRTTITGWSFEPRLSDADKYAQPSPKQPKEESK